MIKRSRCLGAHGVAYAAHAQQHAQRRLCDHVDLPVRKQRVELLQLARPVLGQEQRHDELKVERELQPRVLRQRVREECCAALVLSCAAAVCVVVIISEGEHMRQAIVGVGAVRSEQPTQVLAQVLEQRGLLGGVVAQRTALTCSTPNPGEYPQILNFRRETRHNMSTF